MYDLFFHPAWRKKATEHLESPAMRCSRPSFDLGFVSLSCCTPFILLHTKQILLFQCLRRSKATTLHVFHQRKQWSIKSPTYHLPVYYIPTILISHFSLSHLTTTERIPEIQEKLRASGQFAFAKPYQVLLLNCTCTGFAILLVDQNSTTFISRSSVQGT